MANCGHESELKMLRALIGRLSGEIDYKNMKLLEMTESNRIAVEKWTKEKERVMAERVSIINMMVAENVEKDRLVGLKSADIADLIEEKQSLVAQIVEKDRLVGLKSAHIADLVEEKQRLVAQIVEKDQRFNEILSTAQKVKETVIEEKTTAVSCLTEEKNQLLEAYLNEVAKTKEMKLENEKLQQYLQSQKEELERLIKKHNNMVAKEVVPTNAETESDKVRCCSEPPKSESDYRDLGCEDSGVKTVEQKTLSVLEIQSLEELRAQVVSLRKQLEEKEEVLQNLESDNQTLMIKEVKSNRELQDARRAAAEGFEAMQSPQHRPQNRRVIGIKIMGEVDQKPFRDACLNKFHNSGDWEEKSIELCAFWQSHLSNPGWQPFRKEIVNGELTEVIDEDDPMLKELRQNWGDEAYKAVAEALLGVNEYNASGRYPVPELWNYKENRKATLAEVVQYVIKQWRTHKNKNKKIKDNN